MNLILLATRFHIGSGYKRPEVLENAIRHSKNLIDIGKKLGHPIKILDIGGGFPGFDTEEASFKKVCISLIGNKISENIYHSGREVYHILLLRHHFLI